jgi:hypothetical protein
MTRLLSGEWRNPLYQTRVWFAPTLGRDDGAVNLDRGFHRLYNHWWCLLFQLGYLQQICNRIFLAD